MALGQSKSLFKPSKPKPPKSAKVTRGGIKDSVMAGGAKPPGTGIPKTSTIVPRTKQDVADNRGITPTQFLEYTRTGGAGGSGTGGFADTSGGAMPGGYAPANYNAAFWGNPDALAQDFLSGLGIDNPAMTNEFAPTVDALQLLTSFLGADAAGELLDASGQANQMNSYMAQLTTPGGQALDPGAIMMAIANADPNSAAGLALSQMDPAAVEAIAMQLISAAGGNPFQAQGLRAGFEQGARDYNIDFAKGGQGESSRPYWQNLNQGPLGSFFGG